jgi:hypothetical protein
MEKRVAASNVQAVWKRFDCKLSFMQFFHYDLYKPIEI